MKLLFERLTSDPDWQLREAVQAAVAQLTATETLRVEGAPPGILNFGLPHPVEMSTSPIAMTRYGETLAKRIAQFEPRLEVLEVNVVGRQLQLTARLQNEDEAMTWRLN